MQVKHCFLAAIFFMGSFASAKDKKAPSELKIDIKKSFLTWKGDKVLGAGSHHGKVSLQEGTITLSPEGTPTAGRFVIDMNSIDCIDLASDAKSKGKLEGHLKSEDFFKTDTFPTATFTLSKASKEKSGDFKLDGDLTVRGSTHPVSFTAKITKEKDGYKASFAPFVVDRTKYKITYASFGIVKVAQDKAIKNEMHIGGEIFATK